MWNREIVLVSNKIKEIRSNVLVEKTIVHHTWHFPLFNLSDLLKLGHEEKKRKVIEVGKEENTHT